MPIGIAELVVLVALLAGLMWLLRPLRRRVTDWVARRTMRGRYGVVVEGKFRAAKPGAERSEAKPERAERSEATPEGAERSDEPPKGDTDGKQ
ncbi:MAG: hypothetical protein ACYCWW_15855 [Deltaproteobacteria bacterium]